MRVVVACFVLIGCTSTDVGERRVDPPCTPFSASDSFALVAIPDVKPSEDPFVDIVAGCNVDGLLSMSNDIAACQVTDSLDPERGLRGVDNQLASAKGLLEIYGGVDSDATIVESGTTFDVVISPRTENDGRGCLDVVMRTPSSVHHGLGRTDSNGRVLAQVDGTWQPEHLLGWDETWHVERLHLVLDPGLERVVVGGSQSIDAWLDVLEPLVEEFDSRVHSTLESVADIAPDDDGVCQSVSLAFIAEPI